MEHPITPPPELVQQWDREAVSTEMPWQLYIATQAARWGADQELQACCDWPETPADFADRLQKHRRQKPPSLAEQAMDAQQRMWSGGVTRDDWELTRRALERLAELEALSDE